MPKLNSSELTRHIRNLYGSPRIIRINDSHAFAYPLSPKQSKAILQAFPITLEYSGKRATLSLSDFESIMKQAEVSDMSYGSFVIFNEFIRESLAYFNLSENVNNKEFKIGLIRSNNRVYVYSVMHHFGINPISTVSKGNSQYGYDLLGYVNVYTRYPGTTEDESETHAIILYGDMFSMYPVKKSDIYLGEKYLYPIEYISIGGDKIATNSFNLQAARTDIDMHEYSDALNRRIKYKLTDLLQKSLNVGTSGAAT